MYYNKLFNKAILLTFLFSFSFSGLVLAQNMTVEGTVRSGQDEQPFPGVTVSVKGTSNGTLTNAEGKYILNEVSSDDSLTFSAVGYVQQTVSVNGRTSINITLRSKTTGLDEVVVIGYGTVKKNDLTGSVSTVEADQINKGVVTSPADLLRGKSAGVVITSGSGQPGSASTIRIRGGSSLKATNDPLIVIDGLPISNESISGMGDPLASINPNDIESFTVLKDASATAIYGSRASNGVIVITTKKGSKGGSAKIGRAHV